MLSELKGLLYRISKKHNITPGNAFKIFNLLKAKVKNKLNCNTGNCNKSFLISHIKQNFIFGIFSNLSNFDYDLLISMICGTVCNDLYNIQFVPESSSVTCDDRENEQTMIIVIRNEGETTLPEGYVFTLSFTNVNEPYTIDSGFCTIVGNELTTKASLAPGASFTITIVSYSDKCDPVLSVISITGVSLFPVEDLYLTLPNMDLKVTEKGIATCEEGRMTVQFTLNMSAALISYTVAPPSEYQLIWSLNGSNINLLDYNGSVAITSGFGAVASLNADFSLLTVETAWTTSITDELYLTVEIDNALCDDYEVGLQALPLFPYIDADLDNNTVTSIYELPFYHLSGGQIVQVCKSDNRDISFEIINTSNQILPMGTVFDLVWTGLPGGIVFMDTFSGDISVDGLTVTLLNNIGIGSFFSIMIRITDTGCASPITGISLTITTDDLVLTNPPLVMSM